MFDTVEVPRTHVEAAAAMLAWLKEEVDREGDAIERLMEHQHTLEQRIANQRRALAELNAAHAEQKWRLTCHEDFINSIPMDQFLTLMRAQQAKAQPFETDEQRREREAQEEDVCDCYLCQEGLWPLNA